MQRKIQGAAPAGTRHDPQDDRLAGTITHQAKPPATAVVYHGAELWCAEAERIYSNCP
jgi:hypothetical protein